MKKEARIKAQATRAAKATKFATQSIPIGDHWKVSREDELNWKVEYKGKFYGYYGTLLAAFETIPAKMLGEEAKNSIADIRDSQRVILEEIRDAIPAEV